MIISWFISWDTHMYVLQPGHIQFLYYPCHYFFQLISGKLKKTNHSFCSVFGVEQCSVYSRCDYVTNNSLSTLKARWVHGSTCADWITSGERAEPCFKSNRYHWRCSKHHNTTAGLLSWARSCSVFQFPWKQLQE